MFVINVDLSDILPLKNLPQVLQEATKRISREYAEEVWAKGVEFAHERLHSRLEPFMKAYHKPEEQENNTWVINLEDKWRWIDEGLPAGDMLEAILKSDKADEHGNVIVPFKHGPGKGPAQTTPAQLDLINTIKSEMRKRNIPFGKIEMDMNGKAKMGKLHSFNIMDQPKKTRQGPWQGWGPIGRVRQGPTGIPFLRGVNVYQKEDKESKFGAKKEIFTFRTASPKQRGKGMWQHPGLPGTKIFDDIEKWGQDHAEEMIVPKIMAEIDKLK